MSSKKIHPLSQIAPLPELDIFTIPSTQVAIERDNITEQRPTSNIRSTSLIEFNFITNEDEYIQFKESLFAISLRIKLKKKTVHSHKMTLSGRKCPVSRT